MPWSKTTSHDDCDGVAVVKDGTGEVEGCHDTEEAADDQLAALYASEERARTDEEWAEKMQAEEDGVTNFPENGDDDEPTLQNSKHDTPDAEFVESIRENNEEIWNAGGNQRGNDSYEMWRRYQDGERSDAVKGWLYVREDWGDRHGDDGAQLNNEDGPEPVPSNIGGVVAQIKWGVVPSGQGTLTEQQQKDALLAAIKTAEGKGDRAPELSDDVETGLREKVEEHNEKHADGTDSKYHVTYRMLKAVFRRGVGAYETNPESVRPNVQSAEQWAYARVNSFLYAVRNDNFQGGEHDRDLMPDGHPLKSKGENSFSNDTTRAMQVPDEEPFAVEGMEVEMEESGYYYPLYTSEEAAEEASFNGGVHEHEFEEVDEMLYMPDEPQVHAGDEAPDLPMAMPEEEMSATLGRSLEGEKYTSRITNPSIRDGADGTVMVKVMTDQLARDGMVLDPGGLRTEDYEKNPVVLWEHGGDPRRGAEPIARCTDLIEKEDGYLAKVEFAEDEFAQRIERKVRNQYINAVSVGWKTEEVQREDRGEGMVPVVQRGDMTEFSFVGVPADTDALVQSRKHYGEEDEEMWPNHRSVIKGFCIAEACRRAMNGEMTMQQAKRAVKMEMDRRLDGGREAVMGPACPFGDGEQFAELADILSADAEVLRMSAASEGCIYDEMQEENTTDSEERGSGDTSPSPSAQDDTSSGAERDESPSQALTRADAIRLIQEMAPEIKKIRDQKARHEAQKTLGIR